MEISSTQDFEESIYDQDISVESLSLSEFSKGNYFWRVIPYYNVNEIGYGETSPVMTFSIEEKEEILPPQLTIPADGETLVYKNDDFEALFLWKSDLAQAKYELIISKDSDFN